MSTPLTDLQEEALRSLHRGWRFGIDRRTEVALKKRRLVREGWFRLGDGSIWRLPVLTDRGRNVAARLVAAQLTEAGARQVRRGLLIIDGGAG